MPRADAAPPDAAPPPPPAHLLLSEVYSQVSIDEFVEIYNPTDSEVDLSDYYLADTPEYPRLPEGLPAIAARDWVVRFPAGARIDAGEVVTVAARADTFIGAYGAPPDYALTGTGAPLMDAVAIDTDPRLEDTGEMLALFTWDGNSDLVADVDLLLVGIPQNDDNRLPDKSGLSVDGPDADGTPSSYAADAMTMPRFFDVTNSAQSYKRLAFEGFDEVAEGGNGLTGHDETSENLRATWSQNTALSAPTPGTVDLLFP